ncbi:unnamed protein product [Closterium sp. NIES-64]|nr:unnamed protein product [Closterium sp. NIES-64]
MDAIAASCYTTDSDDARPPRLHEFVAASPPMRRVACRRTANAGRARQYMARWTPEEDAILLEHVMAHGTAEWGQLRASGRLPLRDNKACCNRFLLLKRKFLQHEQQHEPQPEFPSFRRPHHPPHPSGLPCGLQPRDTALHSSPWHLVGTAPAGVRLGASVNAFVKTFDTPDAIPVTDMAWQSDLLHGTAPRQQQAHPRLLEQSVARRTVMADDWQGCERQEANAAWHGMMDPWLESALMGPSVRSDVVGFDCVSERKRVKTAVADCGAQPGREHSSATVPSALNHTASPTSSLASPPPIPTTSDATAAQPAAHTGRLCAAQLHLPATTAPSPRHCDNTAAPPPSAPLHGPPAAPAAPATSASIPSPLAGADAVTSVGAGAPEGQREADLDRWILEQVGLMAGGQGV